MISLVMLYPGLSALRLVGTDLVQAVPLVAAAAISNIALNGLDWHLLVPLLIGSVPGTVLGSHIAPRVKQSYIRRGIVIVLTMSGLALLDKSGWAPLGAGEDQTHPELIALVGLAMVVVLPFVWGLIRRAEGMPMFGCPTVAELEGEPPAGRGVSAPRPRRPGPGPARRSRKDRTSAATTSTGASKASARAVTISDSVRVAVHAAPRSGRAEPSKTYGGTVEVVEVEDHHPVAADSTYAVPGDAPPDGRRPGGTAAPARSGRHAPSLGLAPSAVSMFAAVPHREAPTPT